MGNRVISAWRGDYACCVAADSRAYLHIGYGEVAAAFRQMDTAVMVYLYCDAFCRQIALGRFCVYTRCFTLRAARSDCAFDVEFAHGKRVDVARSRGVLGRVFTNFYTEGVFCCHVIWPGIVIFERTSSLPSWLASIPIPVPCFALIVSEPEIVIACPSELLDVFTPNDVGVVVDCFCGIPVHSVNSRNFEVCNLTAGLDESEIFISLDRGNVPEAIISTSAQNA